MQLTQTNIAENTSKQQNITIMKENKKCAKGFLKMYSFYIHLMLSSEYFESS